MPETFKIVIENTTEWYTTWVSKEQLQAILERLDIDITQSNDNSIVNLKEEVTKKLKL